MSKHIQMTAQAREGTGKGTARSLRREGKVPAVIYGNNQPPVTITLDANDITTQYHKGHLFTHLTDIDLDGKKQLVLARDVQTHVVKDHVLHVDFLRVSEKTKIAVNIPVHFVGHDDSPALSTNGILNVVRYEIELYCKATEIPEAIEVNLAGKDFGDAIKISEVTLPNGATPVISDRDFTIATIVEPKKAEDLEEELAEGEEGEVAEGEEGEEASTEGGEEASGEEAAKEE